MSDGVRHGGTDSNEDNPQAHGFESVTLADLAAALEAISVEVEGVPGAYTLNGSLGPALLDAARRAGVSEAEAREAFDDCRVSGTLDDLLDHAVDAEVGATVSASRTSGLWGIARFELLGRAYLLEFGDECADADSFEYSFFSAWAPLDNDEAREAAFLIAYREAIDMMPFPPAEYVTFDVGPPDLIARAMVVQFDQGGWTEALKRIRERQNRLPLTDIDPCDLAERIRTSEQAVREATEFLEQGLVTGTEIGSLDDEVLLALAGVCWLYVGT